MQSLYELNQTILTVHLYDEIQLNFKKSRERDSQVPYTIPFWEEEKYATCTRGSIGCESIYGIPCSYSETIIFFSKIALASKC